MKQYARQMIFIGIALLLISAISYAISPDSVTSTLPYGRGVVRYHNSFAQITRTIGAILAIWGWLIKS